VNNTQRNLTAIKPKENRLRLDRTTFNNINEARSRSNDMLLSTRQRLIPRPVGPRNTSGHRHDRPKAKGHQIYHGFTLFLLIVLILSMVLTVVGVCLFIDYSNGVRSNYKSLNAGIELEWGQSSSNVSPAFNIDLTPRINDSDLSGISIDVLASFSSNNPFAFAFMSPYTIILQNCPTTSWTYKNFGNASLIYLTYNPNTNKTHPEDTLHSTCAFFFTGLTYRYDRGTYSIALPFAAGAPIWVWEYVIQKSPQLISDQTLVLHLNLYVPADYPRISSTPPYLYSKPDLAQHFILVHIDMNQVNDLEITYQNPDAVNAYSNEETLGILLIGVGLPLMLTTPGEIYRTLQERKRQKTNN
jgi:hypothetical protein